MLVTCACVCVCEPVALGTGEMVWKGTGGNHSHLVGFRAALCSHCSVCVCVRVFGVLYSMPLQLCSTTSWGDSLCKCVCVFSFHVVALFAWGISAGSYHSAAALCWPPRTENKSNIMSHPEKSLHHVHHFLCNTWAMIKKQPKTCYANSVGLEVKNDSPA